MDLSFGQQHPDPNLFLALPRPRMLPFKMSLFCSADLNSLRRAFVFLLAISAQVLKFLLKKYPSQNIEYDPAKAKVADKTVEAEV